MKFSQRALSHHFPSLVLNLLLSEDDQCTAMLRAMDIWTDVDWGDFLNYCQKNVVLVRVYIALKQLKKPIHPLFESAAQQEMARIASMTTLIHDMSRFLDQNGVEFVMTKSFMHDPDMGHDIDLLIRESSLRADGLIQQQYQMSLGADSVANRVAGKRGYVAAGVGDIEIHHGRLGQVGEYAQYAQQVIDQKMVLDMHHVRTFVPAPVDQFMIQVLQRIYGHGHIRLSDLIRTVDLIRRCVVRADILADMSHRLGVVFGVRAYLGFVCEIYYQCFGQELFHDQSFISAWVGERRLLLLKDGTYRVPLKIVLFAYIKKVGHDLVSFNGHGLKKLSIIPALIVVALFRKVIRSFVSMFRMRTVRAELISK